MFATLRIASSQVSLGWAHCISAVARRKISQTYSVWLRGMSARKLLYTYVFYFMTVIVVSTLRRLWRDLKGHSGSAGQVGQCSTTMECICVKSHEMFLLAYNAPLSKDSLSFNCASQDYQSCNLRSTLFAGLTSPNCHINSRRLLTTVSFQPKAKAWTYI
jgi:hypothetical protein